VEEKAAFVRSMFNRIAHHYDLLNRLMTASLDQVWRDRLARVAPQGGQALILDLATGTGDLALAFLRRHPSSRIIGLDFCDAMLQVARRKMEVAHVNGRIILLEGDALKLPFAEGSFDGLITAFAMRNVASIPATLSEAHRVLKSSGFMLCLEIASPPWSLFRPLFDFYFERIIPLIGGLISGDRGAYAYLPNSLEKFLPPGEFKEVMEKAGFTEVEYKYLFPGTAVLHSGLKR